MLRRPPFSQFHTTYHMVELDVELVFFGIRSPLQAFQCFQHVRDKSGRTGRFGDVMMTYLPPLIVPTVAEIVADTSSLHHQIDQSFSISHRHWKTWRYEKMGRPGHKASYMHCKAWLLHCEALKWNAIPLTCRSADHVHILQCRGL